MKLYSRGQVILYSFLTGLIIVMLAVGFGIFKFPWLNSAAKTTEKQAASMAINAENQSGAAGNAEFIQASQIIPLNTADLVQYSEDERENISIYEQLNPGVVNITTETVGINWFLEPVPQDGGSGSGSIFDTRGYVITNNHVINNASKIYINLSDGSQYEGTVVGTDPENDIAVLKFTPPKDMELRIIPFGSSDNLKVGQKVLAIGNPFALERTLTVGIVSGLGRPIQISTNNVIRDMIQTDASINPGNSGGPLLDAHGRMIGINTMIYSPSGGSVGIGFAIPVNTAKRVVAEILEFGKVRRGWIDATVVQIFPALVQYAKLPVNSGLMVSRTVSNGLAEKAGLRQGTDPVQYGRSVIYIGGDIITAANGMKVNTLSDLYSALESSKPGDVVKMEILRAGKPLSINITLVDMETTTASATATTTTGR